MAKNKKPKKHGHRKGAIMGRSDIPFAERLALQQRNDIAVNRERAAKIAMYCLSIAMHELEGIGYKRLVRFSFRLKDVISEFYEDVEVGMAHARTRLGQIGIEIAGDFYTYAIEGETKRDRQLHENAMQAVQIALLCGAIAMNDEFGFGEERQNRISERVAELAGRYAKEGAGFLLREMEKIGFQIVDGDATAYIDDGNAVKTSRAMLEGQR